MAGAVYFISIPGVTNGAGGSRRASGNATGTGTENQPQLQQVRPQSAIAGGGMSVHALKSHGSSDSTSLPYPGDAVPGYAESPNSHSQPNLQRQVEPHGHDAYPQGPGPSAINSFAGSGSGAVRGSSGSPSVAHSTPSWVLPKKTSAGSVGQGSGAPLGAGAGGSSSHLGMQNQFAGMSVSDASG
jgi:signal transducing adaptor molecule